MAAAGSRDFPGASSKNRRQIRDESDAYFFGTVFSMKGLMGEASSAKSLDFQQPDKKSGQF